MNICECCMEINCICTIPFKLTRRETPDLKRIKDLEHKLENVISNIIDELDDLLRSKLINQYIYKRIMLQIEKGRGSNE